ncbi:hypothetical protein CAAN1_01S10440 [[Candida] anglica]|uniref:DUF1774-domain-containing protein n=1 Tax=[Candida] anglica TaxID=148631 RepID=A0ABP0EK93_9ASCO
MSTTTSSNTLNTHKVATTLSLALSIYGNFRYLVGRSPYDKHSGFHVDNTPFTLNILVTLIFWGILYFLQVSFVTQTFFSSSSSTTGGNVSRSEITNVVGWHFTVFNILSFVWSLLFARKHWFLSEIVLIINFLNIIVLYFGHKTYAIKPLSTWTLVHLPTAAFPLSWLLYAIFWNGAVLFHIHKFVGRVVANVLIWDFLLVPGFFLFIFNDYGVGFSSTILAFGLGLGQLFTKAFALQWIFAFTIAGLLFVLSTIAAVTGGLHTQTRSTDAEAAPLLEN